GRVLSLLAGALLRRLVRRGVQRPDLADPARQLDRRAAVHQHLVESRVHAAALAGQADHGGEIEVLAGSVQGQQPGLAGPAPDRDVLVAQWRPARDAAEVAEAVDRLAGGGTVDGQLPRVDRKSVV